MTGSAKRRGRAKEAGSFRPSRLDEVQGQAEAVSALRVAVDAAKSRGDMPGHILLCGPAGTGKTTLALCVANEMGGNLVQLFGTGLRGPGDLIPPLMALKARDVIFVDEIHRMWRPAQETLYPVMEDGQLPLGNAGMLTLPKVGRGGARGLGFTLIGATTDPERLLTPMLDRFALIVRLRPYTPAELVTIAVRTAGVLNVNLTAEAAEAIAHAADGIPRVTIRLVRAARDYARNGAVDLAAVTSVLSSPALLWRTEGRDAG